LSARIAIAGAGLSGAVLARQLAENSAHCIVVFDERSHIGGNCHTERDPATGILLHTYGPHIFHTDREDIWRYVGRFAEFMPFLNRVKAVTPRGVFPIPVNLLTLNQFFGRTFNPAEARAFLATRCDRGAGEARNFEELALQQFGRELYETFFYGYTKKQWGCEPRDLPASILARMPLRFNYDDAYYNSRFQGIPRDGYTPLIRAILDHPSIELRLGESLTRAARGDFHHLFFSGPIDAWFQHSLGRLRYRTVHFQRLEGEGDLQGNPVLNYTDENVPYTRVHEHKHFAPWEQHQRSVAFQEFSKATEAGDSPYYPVRLLDDKKLFSSYRNLAAEEKGVSFLGRLGTYRYLNMDQVIAEALDFSRETLQAWSDNRPAPSFPHAMGNSVLS